VLERACAILGDAGRLAAKATIVDVGAHIGTTTIPALTHQGFVRAIAIEPDPAHLPLLRANIALNGLEERVTVIAAGVSDTHRERQPFVQGSRKEGAYRWMKGRLAEESSPGAVSVETVALDGLAEAGMVDPATTGLLWFDCGRCEEQALRSASLFLERRVPLVFTLRQHQFTKPGDLLARLRETYGHVVDLRSPSLADPVSEWARTIRPIDDLATLPEDRKITDALVF
jgi:FkbM family methyltransferase